jgi:valyl-tRNA synthetase
MSKSKGNVLDPLELIDEFGADALRFTLTALAAQGRDIKLSPGRVEGYRNFVTKLWNAARYTELNGCRSNPKFDPAACKLTINKWIIGETARVNEAIVSGLRGYRFNDAAHAVYHFAWHLFCDWYLEFTKPILQTGDIDDQTEVRDTTAWVLDQLLKFLHPMMPFVTEELWKELEPKGGREKLLIAEPWPEVDVSLRSSSSEEDMEWVIRFISEIRTVRSEMNVPPSSRLPLTLSSKSDLVNNRVKKFEELLLSLGRLSDIKVSENIPPEAVQVVIDEAVAALPVGDFINVESERARLEKEMEKIDLEIGKITKKLKNPNFISKAPPEVVEEQRRRSEEYGVSKQKLEEAYSRFSAL